MMNDMNDMVHVGCEEMISADDEAQMEYERAEHERAEREAQAQQPSHKEVAGVCEDAPCCGCCGGSMDDGYGTYADDAWHDANEYPEW
jgi:hypothetical protein